MSNMNREEIIKLARQRKVRLVVCDGHVTSETDGQHHYIGPMTLLHLYGVPVGTPYVVYPSRSDEFFGWRDHPDDIQLHPMRNGNYSLEATAIRARGQS